MQNLGKCLMLITLLLSSATSVAGRYEFLGYLNGGETIEMSEYELVLPVAGGAFASAEWRHFEDGEALESIVVNIGLGEEYSWAGHIQVQALDRDFDSYPGSLYPDVDFTEYPMSDGLTCVRSPLKPGDNSGFKHFYEYVLFCQDAAENLVYRINFSEMNIMARPPTEHFHSAASDFFAGISKL